MADEYRIYAPLPLDADEVAERFLTRLSELIPGWTPADGDVETHLADCFAQEIADLGLQISDVTRAIFRAWGPLIGVPPVEATAAQADTTWTAVDDAGYTIQAGTLVGARVAGDELVAFSVDVDVVIPPGQTSTAPGAVRVTAVEPGAAASGLTGTMELIDALPWVQGDVVTIEGATYGGQDAELDDAYLDRLSREAELISPRPILADDFGILAARIPGVASAVGIDGYDPNTDTYGNERMVAVAARDALGQPVGAGVKAAITAYFDTVREAGFLVHVIDPTYTTIDVAFTAVARPGHDPAAVEAAALEAVASYLDPARWGTPDSGDLASSGGWWSVGHVRLFEVATVLNLVDGLDYITSLTINGGTADVALTGAAPLPQPGSITGSVTA